MKTNPMHAQYIQLIQSILISKWLYNISINKFKYNPTLDMFVFSSARH